MALTIWHNPRCSKSRQTLALIEDAGRPVTIREYLKDPPAEAELREALRALGARPRDIIRKGEAAYTELGLADRGIGDDRLIAAMAEHPILIERPIVLANGKAALGRPPESVLEILE